MFLCLSQFSGHWKLRTTNSTMKSNFQRSCSKVWWGNDEPPKQFQHGRPMYHSLGKVESNFRNIPTISENRVSPQSTIIPRRDSPGSLRSQDSGFSDSDHSPNSSNGSGHTKSPPIDENRNYLKTSPNKLSPKLDVNYQINVANSASSTDRSPSICSEVITPPTVIRKQQNVSLNALAARRISFSVPSSPSSPEKSLQNFTSGEIFAANNSSLNDGHLGDISSESSRSAKGNRSLRRGRALTSEGGESYRRLSQRKLLRCVSHVSGSVGDVYTLATPKPLSKNADPDHIYESVASIPGRSPQRPEQQTPKRSGPSVAHATPYNNETVTFGSAIEPTPKKSPPLEPNVQERLPLPTYDELYPNGTSTPKFIGKNIPNKSCTKSMNGTNRKNASYNRTRNRLFSGDMDLDLDLSLSAAINWETCTYIEYTNPLLNGHASSVQFWLDETRASYNHEILSTLQTKSVLHEAARSLKLNAAIAAKLIHQIQLKALHIEGNFDEVESVFVSHARASRGVESDELKNIHYLSEDQFKDIIPNLVKQLISNVCLFMSKLNSRVIFQTISGTDNEPGELKKFERCVKTVVEMSQDLQVACDTKIDDIEAHKLLEDLQSLKHGVLKTIRKIYRRLVNIIVSRIESNTNELLLQASVNTISSLPLEGNVYNRSDSFASLNKAFMDTGAIRVLLLVCLDIEQTSIRAMALRALATICSTSDMIEQFLQMGGIDVVTDLLLDDKKRDDKFDGELREAVSVVTQVTAPWHIESHLEIDEFLRVSVDKMVTRITQLLEQTDCPQMLILCTACLNNLSQNTDLTFYSLMANRSILRIRQACDALDGHREFMDSCVFQYVSLIYQNYIYQHFK